MAKLLDQVHGLSAESELWRRPPAIIFQSDDVLAHSLSLSPEGSGVVEIQDSRNPSRRKQMGSQQTVTNAIDPQSKKTATAASHSDFSFAPSSQLMSLNFFRGFTMFLLIAGLLGVIAGYALNPVTPIIKRICTSSFVIVSGGWCLLALAFSYWLIDVMRFQKWARFFCYVGMNSLFIYLFTETGGAHWIARIVQPFAMGILGWMGELSARIATSLTVWGLLWYFCYWLCRRKIFIKI